MLPTVRLALRLIPVLLVLLAIGWMLIPWLCKNPVAGGVRGGRLADCPGSPNCVASQASRAEQQVQPLPYTGDAEAALQQLKRLVQDMRGTSVQTQAGRYLHVTFRTPLMRFVDDVEFLVDEAAQVIHVRSASRLGHSDLGANAARMETIQRRWAKLARH